MSKDLAATSNFLLVSIPQRYEQPKGPRNPTNGLGLTLLSGEDSMNELIAQIKTGGVLQIETETDTSIKNLVRVGQVLAIPQQLTSEMVLCSAGYNKVRTYADITPVVEVGDSVYLDWSALTDEAEILPGIYRVPYAAVICVICETTFSIGGSPMQNLLIPVGGYVLLSRVWADDVTEYEVDDRMQKVRWNEAGTLIAEYNVAPLPNEGIVAFVDMPLKGALNELHPGQRVVFSAGHALIENIAGTEYVAVRHDYCLAVMQPVDMYAAGIDPYEADEWGTKQHSHVASFPALHPAYNA